MIFEKARVLKNNKIAPGEVFQLFLRTKISESAFPGQFVALQPRQFVALQPLVGVPRPFAIYYALPRESLSIVFKVVGENTKWYSELKPGDNIWVLGPCGQPAIAMIDDKAELFILVGGGYGLAALHFLAHRISELTEARIIVAAGFQGKDLVFGRGDFGRFVEPILLVTEDGSMGNKGTAVDLFQSILSDKDNLPDPSRIRVFTCGPKEMMQEIAFIAVKKNISGFAFLEEMMGCGRGICNGCAIKTTGGYKCVCKDGPIFSFEEVIWGDGNNSKEEY